MIVIGIVALYVIGALAITYMIRWFDPRDHTTAGSASVVAMVIAWPAFLMVGLVCTLFIAGYDLLAIVRARRSKS